MKTLHMPIVVISMIYGIIAIASTDLAFAEKATSSFVIDGNEINYESTNVSIADVKFDPEAISLVISITSDKMQDGSMTLFMSQEEADALFSRGPLCKIQPPLLDQFFLLVDGQEKAYEITTDKYIAIKFDIPAGSKTVELIGVGVIGQETGPKIMGIPEFATYKPGQQINLNGVLEDYCGNVISDATIDFKVKNIASLSQRTTTDSLGKFTINFTIPQDSESGRYKATLYGIKKDVNAIWIATLLVQKNGESNTPFIFESPEFGTFEIPYHLENGEIIDVSANLFDNSMSVYYSANQNGTLEIKFPKRLMDFVGKINQISALCYSKCAAYPERLDSDNYRIFEIPVIEGMHIIPFEGLQFGKDLGLDRAGIYPLRIGNEAYPIPYNITGGSLNEISADLTTKTLNVYVYSISPTGGHLLLELPRNVIDSRDNVDKEFLVVNYDRTGKEKLTDYKESKSDIETRILEFNFTKDRNFIYITGTQIVPEFPVTILILAMGLIPILFYKLRRNYRGFVNNP